MELKKGICPLCAERGYDRLQPLITGLCKTHYWQGRVEISKKKKASRPVYQPAEGCLQSLPAWFDFQIARSNWVCENCGGAIPSFNALARSSAQAHILPKALFPSVKTHPDNRLLLGAVYSNCGCHAAYDASWERASRMPVIKIALQRFDRFGHLLTVREIEKLPSVFMKKLLRATCQ